MEAVIAIIAALIVIVLLEAGYRIALCLMRWAPSLLLGLVAGWAAHHLGVKVFEATALFALTTLITRRLLISSFFNGRDHWT